MKESRVVRTVLAMMVVFVTLMLSAAHSVNAANNNGVVPSTDYARLVWLFIGLGAAVLVLFVYYGTRTRMIQQASNWVFAKLSGSYRYEHDIYQMHNH